LDHGFPDAGVEDLVMGLEEVDELLREGGGFFWVAVGDLNNI
jgi:hypothetical protein